MTAQCLAAECLLAVLVFTASILEAAASFEALGARCITGISADGSTVVGSAGRWTAATGWRDMGALPGATETDGALAISGDGWIVVGASPNAAGNFEAFRWMTATGKVSLGMPATPQGTPSYATASR